MRFATDENFDRRILEGLLKRLSEVDIVRVQDTNMRESPDPDLLKWLADEERILLTHDVNTMPGYAYDRIKADLPLPGVIIVARNTPIGLAIDELEIMLQVYTALEFENQVHYIPIR